MQVNTVPTLHYITSSKTTQCRLIPASSNLTHMILLLALREP
jgi:hypothetical protein